MKLSIIIVNYKTPDLTSRCIKSIYLALDSNWRYEIIVVDNNSMDNSKEHILSEFPDVVWVQNASNEGFGRANNLGVSVAKGEFILLLNSDMLLPENTLEVCLEILGNDPEIGLVGCKLLNEDKSNQNSTYYHIAEAQKVLRNNLIYEHFFYKKPNNIKAVMGAFMLMPKAVFTQLKGFDPDFFMYAEEVEFCHRLMNAGYKVKYVDEVHAIHKHGGSSSSDWSLKQCTLSEALLYLKVKGISGYLLYHFLFLLNTITNFFAMWRLDKAYREGYWLVQKGYFANLSHFILIPFKYSSKFGNGKQLLRRSR